MATKTSTYDDIMSPTKTWRRDPNATNVVTDEATGATVPATPTTAPVAQQQNVPNGNAQTAANDDVIKTSKNTEFRKNTNGDWEMYDTSGAQGNTPKQGTLPEGTGIVGSADPTGKGPGRVMLYPTDNVSGSTAQPANDANGDGGGNGGSTDPNAMKKAITGNDANGNDDEAQKTEPVKNYDELLEKLDTPKPEDMEKMRKKEKRDRLFAGIGDVVSALSNLYFTSKGAPNMYDHSKSMSETAKKRWDEIRKQYNEDRDRYNAEYDRRLNELRKDRTEQRQQNYQNEMLRLQRDKFDFEKDLKNRESEIKRLRYEAQNAKDAATAAYNTVKANLLEQGASYDIAEKEAKVALTKARTKQAEAAAQKAMGGGGRKSSSGKGKGSGLGAGEEEVTETTTTKAGKPVGTTRRVKYKQPHQQASTNNSGGSKPATNNSKVRKSRTQL